MGQESCDGFLAVPIQACDRSADAFLDEQISFAADTSSTSAIWIRRFEGAMKKIAYILLFLGSVSFAQLLSASTTTKPVVSAKNNPPDSPSQIFKTAPEVAASPDHPLPNHAFPVRDVKGLLLTCIAPEIDSNPDTDLFKSCTLAPGRTLDDVMHTFIGAMHFLQKEAIKESADLSNGSQK
jgi:hypothetical protein